MDFGLLQWVLRAAIILRALGIFAATAAPLLPCGWQGDEAPFPHAPDGVIATIAKAPGAARLQSEPQEGGGGAAYCGAVVLSDRWVLTARHCVAGKVWRDLRITAGTDTLQRPGAGVTRHAVAAYCAPLRGGRAADIALLRLRDPFPAHITFARLATLAQTLGAQPIFSGTFASWPVKYRNPDPQPVLLSRFQVFARNTSNVFLARALDTGQFPPCSGESGSAFWQDTPEGPVVRGILSAVSSASQGETASSARDICRAPDMIAHITDTARQFAWIRETMDICDGSDKACPVKP